MFRLQRRRMAYKKLGDKQKARALGPFLNAINNVESLLCSIAINKALPSMFDADSTKYATDSQLAEWQHWKPAEFERMLRAVALVSLLAAGLAAPGQDVCWITDEDAIAANKEQLSALAKAFGNMAGNYSTGRIPKVSVMTTADDPGNLEAEDLAAVPDLAAGALADLYTSLDRRGARISNRLTLVAPDDLPGKTLQILHWLRAGGQPLRRVFFIVEKAARHGDAHVTEVLLS